MIQIVKFPGEVPKNQSISNVIEEFGAWRVLGAALGALVRQSTRARAPWTSDLSAHLREDVGLPPIPEPGAPHGWDLPR